MFVMECIITGFLGLIFAMPIMFPDAELKEVAEWTEEEDG